MDVDLCCLSVVKISRMRKALIDVTTYHRRNSYSYRHFGAGSQVDFRHRKDDKRIKRQFQQELRILGIKKDRELTWQSLYGLN